MKITNVLLREINLYLKFVFISLILLNSETFAASKIKPIQDNIKSSTESHIACFLANNFPTVDSPAIDTIMLKQVLQNFPVKFLRNVDQVNNLLNAGNFKVLMLPYGSAFPVDAWPSIYKFLHSGGGLVVFGGYPFHQPVIWKNADNSTVGKWVLGTPQPTYAHQLLIGPADKITLSSSPFYSKGAKVVPVESSQFNVKNFPMPSFVYELTVRFTTKEDFPNEGGTSGPRDAVLRPLFHIINDEGLPVACPLLEIDRLQGTEAGGRWILEPSNAKLTPDIIKACVERALEGATYLTAFPEHASVNKGEIPVIRINQFRPFPAGLAFSMQEGTNSGKGKLEPYKIKVTVTNSKGTEIYSGNTSLAGYDEYQTGEFPINPKEILKPGFYKVIVKNLSAKWQPDFVTTGFWVMDKKLMDSGPQLSVSKDWILRNGKVFPIVGTTYMARDVDRKFLFEPNPYFWNKDFSLMEKEGVNFIRTGIWTGWKRMMLDPGAIDEGTLRALDAFILSAASHNIIVCFNLFAFTPPLNGGSNPYLDPRALDWQKAFVTLIASRYKNVGWITYDLINEPSYSPPNELWNNLPIHDKYEEAAWKKWVKKNHNGNKDVILDEWRDPKDNIGSTPDKNDLNFSRLRGNRLPRKGLDFERFTQNVVKNWTDTLNKVIKSSDKNTLVTLGQDEGGTSLRPSQQFFYTAVDFTSMHTWWNNDDLLWDGVFTKVPEKPNLISETGIMGLENIDGETWRTPETAFKLLERKFAYAFAGRGAGVLEWAWNINTYMPIDNETFIGFFRADGTAKIEIKVLKEFSSFFKKAQPYLSDFEKDKVILVIPHSKMFSGIPNSNDGTQRIIHILADNFGIVPTMLSEYKLTKERLAGAKLIIVPDAEMLYDSASANLYYASQHGTKVLFTGAVEGNEYGQLSKQFMRLKLDYHSTPVSLYEFTNWNLCDSTKESYVTYDKGQEVFLRKSDAPQLTTLTGNILQEPLPLAMAREKGPLIALLKNVLEYSGIKTHYSTVPVTLRILKDKKSALIICVNESSSNLTREAFLDNRVYKIPVAAGRAVLTLVNRADGKIIESTEAKEKIIIE